MNNEVKFFNNEEFGKIRTVMIDDIPYFVGKDVATILGYAEPRSTVSKKVDEEDKGVAKIETPSGIQEMTVINESGLYSLILNSKLESAKRFKRWVTSEVLPTLRKTGTYTIDTTCKYSLPPAAFEGATNAGRLLERIMKLQGSQPHEIAMVVKSIYQQAGIEILDCFIKIPTYEQLSFNEIITRG